ncbi:lysine exporter LysO family protein [Pseudofrancisella aestuarii]|uniref:Lysine exporter LysO family protein n=1 Tax=Pseudofrancisella aestuarii TaxID=2670347 RepID=A0ABV9TAU0_9GAMM|nr:LysO family transporter [Pseudofrancisella aestuarii]
MLESLLIFIALLIGYFFIPLKNKYIVLVNKLIDIQVILIITIMGYNFSIFAKNNDVIIEVINLSLIYTIIIFLTNIIALFILCNLINRNLKQKYIESNVNNKSISTNRFLLIIKSSKYILYLLSGYILGEILNIKITDYLDNLVFIILISLMFTIGAQLKLEEIPLSRIIKNKDAFIISIVVVLTSILPALFISIFLPIPIKESIMISSGLGWYSLSGVLNSNFLGEYYGIATFLIDFLREVIAIALIPIVKKYFSVEMVGYSANTAMDFSLPVIKDTYGMQIVPLAISVGLIMALITPTLLVLENMLL